MADRYGYCSLAEAVVFALNNAGNGVMDNPSQLLSYIADVMDPDSNEMRVLVHLCDDELIEPYRNAMVGGPEELRDAETRMREYLEVGCRIESGTASAISAGFALGVARYLGQGTSLQVQDQDAIQPPPQPWLRSGDQSSPPRGDTTLAVTPGAPSAATRLAIDISGATIWPIEPQLFIGEPLRPEPMVILDRTVLTPGRDYALFYRSNVGSQTRESEAVVMVVGIGSYTGSTTTTFRILPTVAEVSTQTDNNNDMASSSPVLTRRAALALVGGAFVLGTGAILYHRVRYGWRDLVAVSAGGYYTIGLRSNNTVVVSGSDYFNQRDAAKWSDPVSVSAGDYHAVCLHSDGTAEAVGLNDYGQCDVDDWSDLVAVSAGWEHTVGLRSDGTAVAVGYNDCCQCDVDDWSDLIAVSAGDRHTVGLRRDGTAVAVGYAEDGRCSVSRWNDIVAVSTGGDHTVALRSDGTVVAMGANDHGQCGVSSWEGIVAVSAGWEHTVGLRFDGTVVAVGRNDFGQCNVSGWRDITAVSAGGYHTVGLRLDHTAIAVGDNDHGQRDFSNW